MSLAIFLKQRDKPLIEKPLKEAKAHHQSAKARYQRRKNRKKTARTATFILVFPHFFSEVAQVAFKEKRLLSRLSASTDGFCFVLEHKVIHPTQAAMRPRWMDYARYPFLVKLQLPVTARVWRIDYARYPFLVKLQHGRITTVFPIDYARYPFLVKLQPSPLRISAEYNYARYPFLVKLQRPRIRKNVDVKKSRDSGDVCGIL